MSINDECRGTFRIESTSTDATSARQRITERLRQRGCTDEDYFGLMLVLEEALANAIKHGNKQSPTKHIHVDYQLKRIPPDAEPRYRLEVTITDEGDGFDPSSLPDPTLPENLENPNGRGVFLLNQFMDEVHYSDKGNSVTLIKVMTLPHPQPAS